MEWVGVVGYDGLLATQSETVLQVLKALYIYIPIVFSICMPLLLHFFYKLDNIYPQVMDDLEQREKSIKKA